MDPRVEAMARAFSMYMAKDVVHDCAYKTNGCLFNHRDLDVLRQHVGGCPQKPKEVDKGDILAGLSFDKFARNEVVRRTRVVRDLSLIHI